MVRSPEPPAVADVEETATPDAIAVTLEPEKAVVAVDGDTGATRDFWILAALFTLLSLADLLATWRLVVTGMMREGNRLANDALRQYGPNGMAVYKAMLVVIVLVAMWLVAQYRPRLANGVLWGGSIIMTFVALYHLALLSGFSIIHLGG